MIYIRGFIKNIISYSHKIFPLRRYQIMDFMAGASRVWAVKSIFEGDLSPVAVRGGAEMKDITTMMCDLIDTYEPVWRQTSQIHPNIAYVLGGLCDITEKRKYRDWKGQYEEVIVDFDHSHALDYLDSEYRYCELKIKQKGVTPVFATITTMDLQNWNIHRYTQPSNPRRRRKTDYLLFQSEYPKMQRNLNNIIISANNMIRNINKKNKVMTPDLARYVMIPREGSIPGEDMKYKIRTGKSHLHDGCHPSLSIKREWNFHMSAVKTVNRLQLSSPEAVKIIDEASHHRCDLTGVPIEKSTFKFKLSDFNTRSYSSNYSSNYSRHLSRRY